MSRTKISREKSSECETALEVHMVSSNFSHPLLRNLGMWNKIFTSIEYRMIQKTIDPQILSFSAFQIVDEELNYGYKLETEMTSTSIYMIKNLP